MKKIILASGSPRRKQLLEWAEIPFDVLVSATDESYPADLGFEETAVYIAHNKALAVQPLNTKNLTILAADTIVVCNEKIIGKPANREDALAILKELSGSTHRVITGVVLINGSETRSFADSTTVVFHELTQEQIEFYVDKYQPYDKAGAYAIQEWIGVVGIKKVEGDFYNVMGLPVSRVAQLLHSL